MLKQWIRDLKAAFKTPKPYLYGAILLLVVGIYSIYYNVNGQLSNFEYAINASSWVLIPLTILMSIFMHLELHASTGLKKRKIAAAKEASEDAEDESKKEEITAETAANEDAKDETSPEGSPETKPSVKDQLIGVYLTSLVTLILPSLILILYALILSSGGKIYMPTVFGELLGFIFLGSVMNAFAISLAASSKNIIFTGLFTGLGTGLCYLLLPMSTYCSDPFAGMLFFFVIIVLLGFYLYLVTKQTTLPLLVCVVLALAEVAFFTFNQASFQFLASVMMIRLSPFERFAAFVGGLLDVRALIYFAAMACGMVSLAKAAASYTPSPKVKYEEEEEEVKKPAKGSQKYDPEKEKEVKKPLLDGFPIVKPAIICATGLVLSVLVSLTGTALMLDTTGTYLFSPSKQMKEDAAALEKDTTLYWIVQNGKEDESMRSALMFYEAMSPRLTLARCNPNVEVDFITGHVVESVYNNCLLFVSGSMNRFVGFSDMYGYDYSNYETTGTYDIVFNIEDHVAHALETVAGLNNHKIYDLTGHGENELSPFFTDVLAREDMEVLPYGGLTAVPEDAACVLINAPTIDIPAETADFLYEYILKGGDLMVLTRAQDSGEDLKQIQLPNLYSVMLAYGAALIPGVVFETPENAYSSTYPYYVQPNVITSECTLELIASRTSPVLYITQGLISLEKEGVTALPLLVTSEEAYSKVAGYKSNTTLMEDGDFLGTMAVAMAYTLDDSSCVWITSPSLIVDDINTQSSGGNKHFFTGCMNFLTGGQVHQSIPGKLYNYGSLSMNDETYASRMMLLLCIVFPVFYLLIGLSFIFYRIYQRNKLQQEEAEALRRAQDEAARKEEEEKKARREAFLKAREEATRAAIEKNRKKK